MQKEEKNIITALALFIIVIVIIALIGNFTLGEQSDIIQGEAETTEFRVSSKVPGRILRLLVKEGDRVKAGDTVAILEAPDITAKLVQAKAVEKAAFAFNEKVASGVRPQEKQAIYEQWQRAEAAAQIARQTFERVNNLFNEGVVTAQKRDEAEANLKASVAASREAKAMYELARQGADSDEREIAFSKYLQAQGAVEEVDSYIDETRLTAIQDGEVSAIYPTVGELVGAGAPIMDIAYLDELWVSFNMREDLLREFNIGDSVEAYIPALDRHVMLHIYFLKDLGTYAVWRATRTTGEYDIKTFEVRARPAKEIEGLYPGMSVIIEKR